MRNLTKTFSIIMAVALSICLLSGCDRRTPEERLATAIQFYQQDDAASAEMEALKVVEKAPDDPAAVQASMLLAQIYAKQGRFEEAEMQLQSALKNVSQLDPEGKSVLRLYLAALTGQEKYDEALKTVDSYRKEYADDPGTSLSLEIAGADINTMAGHTSTARTILTSVIDRTTEPAEMALYRDMYMRTYLRDADTTGAIGYLEKQLPEAKRPDDKRSVLLGLSTLYAANDDYERSRGYLKELTTDYMDVITKEPDPRARAAMASQLAQTYLSVGNLPGGRRVWQALYDSGMSEPQAVIAVVNGLAETLLRLGETSATASLLKDAAKSNPQGQFADALKRMNEMVASGELQKLAPMDTSTLVMKYKNDSNILWPAELPKVLGTGDVNTSGSVSESDSGTSATISTAVVDSETSETVSTPAVETETSATADSDAVASGSITTSGTM